MESVVVEPAARQPDIAHTPNSKKYQARTKARLHDRSLKQSNLPSGFPHQLATDFVWEGERLADRYDWTYMLSEEDIKELKEALTHFKCQTFSAFRPRRCHLTRLSVEQALRPYQRVDLSLAHFTRGTSDVSKELHFGHGFRVIGGIPVESHSSEDHIIIYAGLSSHVAPVRGR